MQGIFDMHCHIVPGVDDGSKSLEESMAMLEMEYRDGVRNIILTPHFRYDMFEPSDELVQKQYLRLKEAAAGKYKDLNLYLGCELHTSMDMVDCLRSGKRRTLAGSRYVLVEFSGGDEKIYVKERVQKLKLSGYYPIIAHVERYRSVREDLDLIDELRGMGAFIQVNADTITGKDGFMIKRFAKKLLKEELLDFVGSDGHGSKSRTPDMARAYAQVAKVKGESYANRIFIGNPSKIVG